MKSGCIYLFEIWLCLGIWGFPDGSAGRESTCNAGDAGDAGLNPASWRFPGGGNGHPLQYSCLENSMDRGTWWATVHEASKNRTWQSTHRQIHLFLHIYSGSTHAYINVCVIYTQAFIIISYLINIIAWKFAQNKKKLSGLMTCYLLITNIINHSSESEMLIFLKNRNNVPRM